MRQTLISAAILSALSLPGIASAEVGPFNTESRVNPPGATPKGRSLYDWHEDFVVKPRAGAPRTSSGDQPELQRRQQSPRDSASGPPTGRR
jgi:hypothetical protein